VFLNYLLDCLPAAVIDFRDPDQARLPHMRTCLTRPVELAEETP
jgi:hypothetical protein